MLVVHPWVAAAPLAVALVLTRRAAVAVAIVLSAGLNAAAVRQLTPPAPDESLPAEVRVVPLPQLPMPPDDPDAASEFPVEIGPVPGSPDTPEAGGSVAIPSGNPDAKLAASQQTPLSQPPPDLPAVSPQAALDAIRDLVRRAGGYQDGPLTFTIIWFNRNDLDLHVVMPNGDRIWYRNPSAGGGVLDVDRNRAQEELTNKPVENVSWRGKPPAGRYKVYVTFFHPWEDNGAAGAARFLARVLIDGKPALVSGRPITAGEVKYDATFNRETAQQLAFEFEYPAQSTWR